MMTLVLIQVIFSFLKYIFDLKIIYTGSAFVYHKENNQWTQSTKIIPEGGLPNSYYGYSVNLHDLELVVSAYKSDDGGGDTGNINFYDYFHHYFHILIHLKK